MLTNTLCSVLSYLDQEPVLDRLQLLHIPLGYTQEVSWSKNERYNLSENLLPIKALKGYT
jgi:hypothetical protein